MQLAPLLCILNSYFLASPLASAQSTFPMDISRTVSFSTLVVQWSTTSSYCGSLLRCLIPTLIARMVRWTAMLVCLVDSWTWRYSCIQLRREPRIGRNKRSGGVIQSGSYALNQ